MGTLIILLVIGTSVWVLLDAYRYEKEIKKAGRGEHPIAWFLGCLLLWIIVFPYYLIRRSKYRVLTLAENSVKNQPTGRSANIDSVAEKAEVQLETKKCIQCFSDISVMAKKCPRCGSDQRGWSYRHPFLSGLILVVAILATLGIISVLFNDSPSTTTSTGTRPSISFQEAKDRAIEVNYNELFRNNEQYIGEVVYHRGKIIQVSEGWGDNYILRINVTKGEYGFWEDDIYVNYRGKRVLEDDIVDFWGIVKGVKTYKTVLGASRSIPEVDALYLEMADSPTAQIISPEPQTQQQIQPTPTTQQTKPTPSGQGSRTNPVPVGSTVRIGDWSFKVLSSIPNATQVVLAENRFNDPPKTGHQFFMANIEATYLGTDSGSLSFSIKFGTVGSSAIAYDSSCGYSSIPNELNTWKEVFTGGTLSGNICWEIRTDDVNSLVMFIDPSFSFDNTERVFMSLPK